MVGRWPGAGVGGVWGAGALVNGEGEGDGLAPEGMTEGATEGKADGLGEPEGLGGGDGLSVCFRRSFSNADRASASLSLATLICSS